MFPIRQLNKVFKMWQDLHLWAVKLRLAAKISRRNWYLISNCIFFSMKATQKLSNICYWRRVIVVKELDLTKRIVLNYLMKRYIKINDQLTESNLSNDVTTGWTKIKIWPSSFMDPFEIVCICFEDPVSSLSLHYRFF